MNEDQITALYNQSGEKFRDSRVGKLVKSAITSDTTKRLRDLAIDKLGFQEHEKRFIQHLTGGTVGDQPITELPESSLRRISIAHARGNYPDRRELIADPNNLEFGQIPNPNYNPESTLLSTYGMGKETANTLGHVQMNENPDGSFRMTDTYDVDSNISMGDKKYVPLIGERSDLVEGTKKIKLLGREYEIPLASRAHDVSVWLGVNQDMKFDVNIPKQNIDDAKSMYPNKYR
mgnify:CR=1 FL=1